MNAALLFLLLVPPAPVGPPPPPPPPEQTENSPNVIRDRVAQGMAKVEEKLHGKDAGQETLTLQEKIIKDIDALINMLKNPPPSNSPQSEMSPPDGGPSDGSQNKSRAQSKGSGGSRSPQQQPGQSRRDQRRARRNEQMTEQGNSASKPNGDSDGMSANPKPDGQPNEGKEGGGKPPEKVGPSPTGGAGMMSDVIKDVWGHLPETMRQEVDHYYKDQFMPRYRELLQQYYSKLSETKKQAEK